MKIFRILDIGKYESKLKTAKRLDSYGHGMSSNNLKVRNISKPTETTAFINNKEMHGVSMKIKKGYFNSLSDVYEVKNVPKQLELKTLSDVKDLPSYHYGNAERYTNELTNKIKKKSPAGSLDHLEKGTADLTARDLKTSPALNDICDFLKGKSFRTIAGTLVFIGLTTTAVITFLNEHRKALQACLVFYYVNGSLSGCKLPTCTCIDESMNQFTDKYTICSSKILAVLPEDMTRTTNCKGNSGLSCVNCPSDTFKNSIGKDVNEDLNSNTKRDEFYIECRIPSIFNAIGDITHSVGESVISVVDKAASTISWFIKNLPTIIIAGVLFFVIIIIVWLMKTFGIFNWNSSNSSSHTITSDNNINEL